MQKLLEKLNIEWDINEFLHYSVGANVPYTSKSGTKC